MEFLLNLIQQVKMKLFNNSKRFRTFSLIVQIK